MMNTYGEAKINNLRSKLREIFYSNVLYWTNVALIIINFCAVGSISFDPALKHTVIQNLITVIFVFFTIETLCRLIIVGKEYFFSLENMFTLFVIILAFVLRSPEISILFTFRLAKVMRRLNLLPKTRSLLDALLRALPNVVNLLFLIFVCFMVFAFLGTQFFGPKVPNLFGTVAQSLITLSQIMVSDDWGNILNSTIPVYPYSSFYFISFLVLVTFLLVSTFTGIIVNALQDAAAAEKTRMEESKLFKKFLDKIDE
jgi:voltage-gated sodium channel